MATMNINGSTVYYEIAGEGPTVVLGHAGFLDSRMWDDQWAALAAHYRVVRYDMQGYGQSSPAQGSVDRRSELHALLQHLDIERAHLVGSSLSGATFLDFALEHPDRVASLVTVNVAPSGFDMQGEPPRYLMEMFEAGQQGDLDRVSELQLRIWLDGMYREPDQVDATLRQRAAVMNRGPVQNATWFVADMQPLNPLDPPAATRLDAIACPTLIIDSTLDHPEVQRAATEMVRLIPHAQRATIADAAHVPNMEQPAEFNRLVLDFLSARR